MDNKKQNSTQNSILVIVLNLMCLLEIIVGVVLFVLMVWLNERLLILKLLTTDLIIFIASITIYYLCCYGKNKDKY